MLRYPILFVILFCIFATCLSFSIENFAGNRNLQGNGAAATNPIIAKEIEPRVTVDPINIPCSFRQVSRASRSTVLVVHLGLDKGNVQEMENLYWRVSDPKSPLYGKYLTNDDIARKFGATKEPIQAVTN